MNLTIRFKGGPGSGHRGHAGRPGHTGGSAPGAGGGAAGKLTDADITDNTLRWHGTDEISGIVTMSHTGKAKFSNADLEQYVRDNVSTLISDMTGADDIEEVQIALVDQSEPGFLSFSMSIIPTYDAKTRRSKHS